MFGLVWLRHGLRQSQAGLAHPKQLRMALNTCLHLGLWLASPTQAEESKRYTRYQYFSKLFYNTQKQYKTPNTRPHPCVPRKNTYCKHNTHVLTRPWSTKLISKSLMGVSERHFNRQNLTAEYPHTTDTLTRKVVSSRDARPWVPPIPK